MTTHIAEPARQTPVLDEVDVLVVGGGVAGFASAVAAARAGAQTMLIERLGALGGVAGPALMTSMSNYGIAGDGRQMTKGILEELLDRMAARGYTSPGWRSRDLPQIAFDQEGFRLTLVEMLHEADVKVLVETWAVDVIKEGSAVRGVIIESKGGRQAVLCKAAIDASGDADLAYWAGAPCRNTPPDSSSLLFFMSGVDYDKIVQYFLDNPSEWQQYQDMVTTLEQFASNWRVHKQFHLPHGGARNMTIVKDAIARGDYVRDLGLVKSIDIFGLFAYGEGSECLINSSNAAIDELDPVAHSQYELEARRAIPYIAGFLVKHFPGFERARVSQSAVVTGVRITRWIDAGFDLTREHVAEGAKFDDVIGCIASYARHPQGGLIYPPYGVDLPYRIMLPQKVENLLTSSGKSVATAPRGLIRSIVQGLTLGQAAGVASAMAVKRGIAPRALPIRDLQRALLAQNVYLGDQARLVALGLA